MRFLVLIPALLGLSFCEDEMASEPESIRGLKTHLVAETERVSTRRFPSVLEPAEVNSLSFEVAGKLSELNLTVGQFVKEGDVIAKLDTASLQIQLDNAKAGVDVAQASSTNAADNLARQEALLETGAVTRVTVENAQADADAKAAQLEQAEKSLETAEDNLTKAVLTAPFDGVINSVDAQNFSTVSAGTTIATVYSPEGFEVAISVNYDTVSQLVVGKSATIRLADRPDLSLGAVVSELGSRADSVSSFPVVMKLSETNPILKAGMAVEAAIDFPLPATEGFVVPIGVGIKEGQIEKGDGPNDPAPMAVYVYDPDTSTVKRRDVVVGGVSENSLVIVDGLEPGDLVASAGVSFLRDGQKVKLLSDED